MLEHEKAVKLLGLAEKAFSSIERRNASALFDDLEQYFLTNQQANTNVNGSVNTPGASTTYGVYKSTPAVVNRELASILYSTMSPPTKKWSKFRHRDDKLNDIKNVSMWLDQVNDAIHKEFSDSNLYKCLGAAYLTFCALGNGAILHEQKPARADGSYGGVRFTNLHVGQLAWAENNDGVVDEIYRKIQMTARQVVERWPDTAPEKIIEIVETDPSQEVIVIQCLYPRPAKELKKTKTGILPAENRPYGSYFIDKDTGAVLEEDGFYEFPAHVFRFEVMPGEVLGRGPGHIALPDAKTLNQMVKDMHLSRAKALNPCYFSIARNIMSNNADFRPGGITYVRSLDGIKEVGTGARFDVGQMSVEELQQDLSRIFMLDKLLLPPRQDTGEMSAYEVSRRIEEAQRVLGSVPSRIETELLKPMIVRQFNIMLRAGALPPIPSELKNSDLEIDIELVSQLARAQTIEEVSAIQQYVQHIGMLAQINPEAADMVDVDEAAKRGGRILGVPESVISSDEEVKQIRQQRAQMQQMQMQAELQLKQADAQSKMK